MWMHNPVIYREYGKVGKCDCILKYIHIKCQIATFL